MQDLAHPFESNRASAARMRAADPDFFPRLARDARPGLDR